MRGATSALMYDRCFAELLSAYLDHVAVYSDRFFVHDSTTGSAFIYDGQVLSYRLLSFNSIFTAELLVLIAFLLWNSILCTKLFCSSSINLSNIISSAQTP